MTQIKKHICFSNACFTRIRFLESENSDLFEKYKKKNSNLQDQQKLVDRLSQELESNGNLEDYAKKQIFDLRQELLNCKKENEILQNRLKTTSEDFFKLKKDLDKIFLIKNHKISVKIRELQEEKDGLNKELMKKGKLRIFNNKILKIV